MKRLVIPVCALAVFFGAAVAFAQGDTTPTLTVASVTPTTAEPVAPFVLATPVEETAQPVTLDTPATETVTPVTEVAPTPVPVPVPVPATECEVGSATSGGITGWGTYGHTDLPNGTTFSFELTVDGATTVYPLVARQGSVKIHGVVYGDGDGAGTSGVFGFTTDTMPIVSSAAVVSAVVTLDGKKMC